MQQHKKKKKVGKAPNRPRKNRDLMLPCKKNLGKHGLKRVWIKNSNFLPEKWELSMGKLNNKGQDFVWCKMKSGFESDEIPKGI